MSKGRCNRCDRKLVKREGESNYDFNRRVTCGASCPVLRLPSPDSRPRATRQPTGVKPQGLPPVLAEIAAEHPDLAVAIHEIVTMVPNTREGGRWY